jgi:hypothetical protein
VLREFHIWSKLIYFHNLGWIEDPAVIIDHRTCTNTMRYCMCGTKVIASGSIRWGRLRQLHHQRLCGSVILTFCLQRYVTESLIVIALLIDRSWAFWVLRSYILFYFCLDPQHLSPYFADDKGITNKAHYLSTPWPVRISPSWDVVKIWDDIVYRHCNWYWTRPVPWDFATYIKGQERLADGAVLMM